jgi:vesicular inhibitory amino acid transporter
MKFSGHVAVPGLARDMIDPSQFDQMIDTAYLIATTLYGVIGVAGASGFTESRPFADQSLGYCMFGNGISEEFSQDLFSTPGYNELLNKIALYALIITPM